MSTRSRSLGFTLVEMMLVVTVLGILTSIMLSVVNTKMQQKRAKDAVNRSDLEQVSQGLESYFAAEGYYPAALGGTPNMTQARTKEYLSRWPSGFVYVVNARRTQFETYVVASNNNYLKYDSSWGKIKVCSPTQITQLGFCVDVGN